MAAASLAAFPPGRREGAFYHAALACAQAKLLDGLPGQALLMLNRAFAAEPSEKELAVWPLPYRAVAWIVTEARATGYLGNPRVHYQHLATRIRPGTQALAERRIARAWACWAVVRFHRPDLPADTRQLLGEGISEPGQQEIRSLLLDHGIPGEVAVWAGALGESGRKEESPAGPT